MRLHGAARIFAVGSRGNAVIGMGSVPAPVEPKDAAAPSCTMNLEFDARMMRRAIVLSRGNRGKTAANPSVGCVITQAGEVIAEGVTAPGGRPHAEELALLSAGERARGATAYVTLEPCGARTSGAASCAELLVLAGVARVVSAGADASPLASGRGLQRLRAAGIVVECGLLAEEAAEKAS